MGSLQGNTHLALRPTPTNYYYHHHHYYSITAQLWTLATSIFLSRIFRSDTNFFHPAVSSSFPASLITVSIPTCPLASLSINYNTLFRLFLIHLSCRCVQPYPQFSVQYPSLPKPQISLARHIRHSTLPCSGLYIFFTFPFEVFKGHFQLAAPTQPYRLVLKLDS